MASNLSFYFALKVFFFLKVLLKGFIFILNSFIIIVLFILIEGF